jgi:predicted extracellular nuclease
LTGVLDHRFGYYRVQPTMMPEFTASNSRPASPPDVGGRLRVASFNVLNYFNGDGLGDGFPTERGANTPEEFTRQRDKIISAILTLDADVIGLMEIENDGSGPESAAADLVNGLNEAAGETLYAYIPDPAGLKSPAGGGDAIKQAIIYRPATVTPVGDSLTTLDPPFDQYRPPVAQLFEENENGEQFMVVVNHLKSKGCEGAGAAGDEDEGQGCWNNVRTLSAQTLAAWLASDPSGTGDPDVLLIGDLNAYAMEDPLMTLADTGLTNLVVQFEGAGNYSYVFDGRAGSLDHALASESLVEQVSGVATWHINADEPRVLDYNVEFKSENQVESLYDPGPFRSSDHDPVLIGLQLGGPLVEPTAEPTAESTVEPTVELTEEPTVVPTTEPTVEPTLEPTEEPADEDDSSDSSGGTVAIMAGLVAVILAMLAGLIGLRRRAR